MSLPNARGHPRVTPVVAVEAKSGAGVPPVAGTE